MNDFRPSILLDTGTHHSANNLHRDTLSLSINDPSPVFVPVLMRELENSPRGVSEGGA